MSSSCTRTLKHCKIVWTHEKTGVLWAPSNSSSRPTTLMYGILMATPALSCDLFEFCRPANKCGPVTPAPIAKAIQGSRHCDGFASVHCDQHGLHCYLIDTVDAIHCHSGSWSNLADEVPVNYQLHVAGQLASRHIFRPLLQAHWRHQQSRPTCLGHKEPFVWRLSGKRYTCSFRICVSTNLLRSARMR